MRHIISALWVGLQLTANAAELQTTEMAQKASASQRVAIDVGLFDRVGLPKSILEPAKAAAVGAREAAMSFPQEEKSGFKSRFPREPPTRSPYAQRTRLTIEVHICNHTAIPNESLDLARQETARILERIDVSTLWVVCSVTAQEVAGTDWLRDTRPVFVLRILPKQMADKLQPGSDIFRLRVPA